jgi:hypothetical protein
MRLMFLTCLKILIAAGSEADAMGSFPHDAPRVVNKARCPPRKSYDAATVQKLGRELRDLLARDAKAVTPSLVRDYRTLRRQCDAIEK